MKRRDAARYLEVETRAVSLTKWKGPALTHAVGRPAGATVVAPLCPFVALKALAPADPDTSWRAPTCKRCRQLDPRFPMPQRRAEGDA